MMNAIAQVAATGMVDRQTPISKPCVVSALATSPFRVAPWNARDALAALPADVRRCDLANDADRVARALVPVAAERLHKRLSRMALAFGNDRDANRATAWLSETARLLADLPDDILAAALDEAVKSNARGFMPAVGQIRAFAEPALATRRQQAARLAAMLAVSQPTVVATDRGSEADPEGAACDPADVARMNRVMRRFGCTTRYRADGSDYQLQPGEVDPAE